MDKSDHREDPAMKHLIVYCHPNPKSFSHAIQETAADASRAKGCDTVVRDLYAQGFDPVLKASDFEAFRSGKIPADIAEEQKHVAWADLITFVYPIWWTGLPAVIKGYIDRVFSNGFAFSYGEAGPVGLLKGKRAVLFTPMGTPNPFYEQSGMLNALHLTSDTGILAFCGLDVVHHEFFGGVPMSDDATRRGMLNQVRRSLEQHL
jgi:NAD(P)H dehydrogenase (quinone)